MYIYIAPPKISLFCFFTGIYVVFCSNFAHSSKSPRWVIDVYIHTSTKHNLVVHP